MIHIEDLPIEEFIEAVRNLNEYDITEKVDGFNLRFGFDEEGFYTKGKAGDPKRRVSEYGNEFRYSGFKSAHAALSHIIPNLLKTNLMKIGDEIESEVLYGSLPNTVPYSGDMNKLIFLKRTKGDPRIPEIKQELDGMHVTIKITVPKTTDGKTIVNTEEEHKWLFSETRRVEPIIIKRIQDDLEFERMLNDLEAFLVKDSGVANFSNAELISIPLNKRHASVEPEAWKSLKGEIKEKRKAIRDHVMGHKLNIKSKLLVDLVRNIESGFGPEIEDGGWIEGLVLRNDDRIFKIVDKDVFTALNKFNWEVRNKVGGSPKGLNKIDSIVGKIKVALATVVGHPELGTTQRNRYLASNNITKRSLANDIKDFHKTQTAFIKILEKGAQILSRYHIAYERLKSNSAVEIEGLKRKLKINPDLDEKNLESFAELYALLATLEMKARGAKNRNDLVELLIDPNTKINESARNVMELFTDTDAKIEWDGEHAMVQIDDTILHLNATYNYSNSYTLVFSINKRGSASAAKIFSAAYIGFKQFIEVNKPSRLVFAGSDARRTSIYQRLIKRFADDWDVEEIDGIRPNSKGFILTRKKDKIIEITDQDAKHQDALNKTGFWGKQGAGVLPIAMDTGRVLLALRSDEVEQPGTWNVWGGAIDDGEDPYKAALREFREEAGSPGKIVKSKHLHEFRSDTFKYNTFAIYVPKEFKPTLNCESSDAQWFEIGKWPTPLHFGLEEIINKGKLTEGSSSASFRDAGRGKQTGLAKISGGASERIMTQGYNAAEYGTKRKSPYKKTENERAWLAGYDHFKSDKADADLNEGRKLLEYNRPDLMNRYAEVFDAKAETDHQVKLIGTLNHTDEYLQKNNISKIIDPYIKWIIHRYVTDGIRKWEDVLSRVVPGLIRYDQLKKKKKLQPTEMDINRIKSESDLLDIVDSYQEVNLDSQAAQKKSVEQQFYDSGKAKLIMNTTEYKIVIPKTKEASCYFGKNTRWCTAATGSENYFSQYHGIIIILHKPTNKRWQFHFITGEYMDEKDHSISLERFAKKHPAVIKFLTKLNLRSMGFKKFLVKFGKATEAQIISVLSQYSGYIKYVKNPSRKAFLAALSHEGIQINKIKNPSEEQIFAAMKSYPDAYKLLNHTTSENKLKAARINGLTLQLIDNPNQRTMLAAVTQNGEAVEWIGVPTETMKMAAVKNVPEVIGWFDNPSEAIQMAAIKIDPDVIEMIKKPTEAVEIAALTLDPGAFRNFGHEASEAAQLLAVKHNGEFITDIYNPSEAVIWAAVEQDIYVLDNLETSDFSERLQLKIVKNDGWAISYFSNPSEKVQLAAVTQDGYQIDEIRLYDTYDNLIQPNEKVQLAAVKQNGRALGLINDPSEKVQLAAVRQNKKAIEDIEDPSERVKRAAR